MMDGASFQYLDPPEHIRGKLHRFSPQSLKDERNKWCADMARAGYSSRKIAEPLGVHRHSVIRFAILGGFDWQAQTKRLSRHHLQRKKYHIGNPFDAFEAAPVHLQHALTAYCRKHNCSVSHAAFRMLSERFPNVG